MDSNLIIDFISNVGFPIAVSVYLLLRFEKVLNNNTKALREIEKKINK